MRLFLLIFLVATALQFLLPWWVVALVSFALAAWLAKGSGHAFLAGFGGIALSWLLMSLYFYIRNEALLAGRVATLFKLPHPALLILVTLIIGGLVGGLAGLAGYFCRRLM